MPYIIGIDSGGTHTNIRLLTPAGEKKTVPELDRSLTSNRSNAELREILGEILASLNGYTLGELAFVWINAAGYSAQSKSRITMLLGEALNGLPLSVGICNDAVGILLAHDSELVTVVAGTGSVAMARNPHGEVIKRGGDEWVVADFGSAFWLGLLGIRAAYSALEGGPDTALLKSLVEQFSPLQDDEHEHEMPVAVREIARRLASLGTDTKPIIASFAPQVTRQAELGDDEAQSIVRRSAEELASASARVYRELAAQAEGRVVLPRFLISGSVAYRSPFYLEAFKASLDQFLFDVRERIDRPVELEHQLNGLSEALVLAQQLADGKTIPKLDEHHEYSICGTIEA